MRVLLSISILLIISGVSAFVVEHRLGNGGAAFHHHTPSTILQVGSGGPGWDNGSFLDGLGSEGDEEGAEQSYQEFKESRQAFFERQQERMNSDAGRKFLQRQQQEGMPPETMEGDDSSSFEEGGGIREPSKFHQMMQQAGRGQRPPGLEWMRGPPGMVQKLAIPLDDDDEVEGGSNRQE